MCYLLRWLSRRCFSAVSKPRLLSHSQLEGPFDFCAFASLSELLLGSLEIALKCTRPRQRFMYVIGRYSMTERDSCQGIANRDCANKEISFDAPYLFTIIHRVLIIKKRELLSII